MMTGFSKIKITPVHSVVMGGHPGEKFSTGVLTDLYARAMAISTDNSLIVFASADVLFVGDDSISRVKREIHDTIAPMAEIFISATHTHSGPLTTELFGNTSRNEYTDVLEEGLCSSIIEAINSMSPSKLYHSEGFVTDMVFCARLLMKGDRIETHPFKDDPDIIAPEGIPDRQFHVLAAYDERNVIKGMLVNFGQHPQIMERACTLISADFPAYTESFVQERLGKDIPVLFVNGPCGDVCPVDAQNADTRETGPDWCRSYGERLGSYVLRSMENRHEIAGRISVRSKQMKLKLRNIPESVLTQAKIFLDGEGLVVTEEPGVSDYGTESRDTEILSLEKYMDTSSWKLQEYRDIMHLAKLRSLSEYQSIELSAIMIGDLAVVTMPFEVFSEIGIQIKACSKRRIAVFELTNGNAGYLPSERSFSRTGGYETRR